MHIPLSLYIHWPWCIKKCPYCDFNSHAGREFAIPEENYLKAVVQDLIHDLPLTHGRPIHSIFIGGGTPSLMSAQGLGWLLEETQKHVSFGPNIEITLEANPGTFEQARFKSFVAAGVTRLSLGAQSFNDAHLKKLGRIHTSSETLTALDTIAALPLKSFNIDLMYGLPKQTTQEALADIQTALSFAPPHLSWYQLTLEPNTVFYKNPPPLPAEGVMADMEEAGLAALHTKLNRYEVSAFSAPAHACQHNLNYWQFGDYLGIGAGAHGKLTQPDGQILRTQKKRLPKDYLKLPFDFTASTHAVPASEIAFEFMLNALRLTEGFDTAQWACTTGLSINTVLPKLNELKQQGLLEQHGCRWRASTLGFRYLNDVVAAFMPD